MQIDRAGNLLDWEFRRVVIKSAARLTYKETEAAIRGEFNGRTKKLFKTAITPLYEAYQALALARKRRGALELETTEVKIRLDKNGNVAAVEKRESLVSHKIIEEFMILANETVAAYFFRRPPAAALQTTGHVSRPRPSVRRKIKRNQTAA